MKIHIEILVLLVTSLLLVSRANGQDNTTNSTNTTTTCLPGSNHAPTTPVPPWNNTNTTKTTTTTITTTTTTTQSPITPPPTPNTPPPAPPNQAPSSTGLTAEASDFFTTEVCTDDATVCDDAENKVCKPTADGTSSQCRCKTEQFWKKEGTACVLQQRWYGRCGNTEVDPKVKCAVPGSECKEDKAVLQGDGLMRCICQDGYIDEKNPDGSVVPAAFDKICVKKLAVTDLNKCEECAADVSTCYRLPNSLTAPFFDDTDAERDGCRCDISYSGATCDTVNVNVGCNFQNEMMRVCYTPHAEIATANIQLGVEGQMNNPSCKASPTALAAEYTEGSFSCPTGSFLLNLDMNLCNTKSSSTAEQITKSNVISIGDSGQLAMRIGAECILTGQVFVSSGQIHVLRYGTNHRGQVVLPKVDMYVTTDTNAKIPGSVVVSKNDEVKICLELDATDDTYGALNVMTCIMSPYSILGTPDGNQQNRVLLKDGCKAPNSNMEFKMVNGDNNKFCTLPMKVPATAISKTTYIHCKVKVCLIGETSELQCAPSDCTGSTRKKRYTDENPFDEENLEVGITIRDAEIQASSQGAPTITMTTMGFSVIVALLIALVAVAVGVVVLLLFKLRATRNKVDDSVEMTQKQPQRFALPRISSNHMRI